MQQEEQYFIPLNGENQLNLMSMISVRPGQTMSPVYSTSKRSEGVAFKSSQSQSSSSSSKATPMTVTPTSTPPIRFNPTSRRVDETISPSPLTTEAQRRYYEDSTWRMYDRIQASRPPKGGLIHPAKASAMFSMPSYPPKDMYETSGEQPNGVEDEEELIFDLEL